MIDTVILMLPRNNATVISSVHGVPTWDLQSSTRAYKKFVRNPSKQDEESGLYFPRLTGYRRRSATGFESILKIEFSAPKLLYKNNLDELEDGQFGAVVEALRDRLNRMGVMISAKDLAEAEVRAVHYSKNIVLRDGYSVRYVIGELGKINLNQRFDMTRARYINEGQSLYAYTTAHSVVLYDKIADLRRGNKRAIDKDSTPYQLGLFGRLKKHYEVLRFEVRLSQTRKMRSLLSALGLPDQPTFKDVFSRTKSQAVLNHYWKRMVCDDSLPLFAHALSAKDVFRQIVLLNKTAKRKESIYLAGLVLLSQESGGMRELREMLSKRMHDRSWYRMVHDLRDISGKLEHIQRRDWFEHISQTLNEYPTFRVPKTENVVL